MSPDIASRIAENLNAVRQRMLSAVERAGRRDADVSLVAVTKYARLEWVRDLVDAGLRTLGESRPQQLVERAAELDRAIEWHLVGHLQRNKVRAVLPHVALIHSVDSMRLLQRVNQLAGETGRPPKVLLEVNISGEASKDGFSPDDLQRVWEEVVSTNPVQIAGLMTMAPACDDPQQARPYFAGLRELRDRLVRQSPEDMTLSELSMGMSADFEVAIEEGATLVRIGSALFEGLAE